MTEEKQDNVRHEDTPAHDNKHEHDQHTPDKLIVDGAEYKKAD
ncbi:MAG TPA: hypothetical protein VGM95_00335 [Lactobacillaceae bacterium]|jgi:hypothetical protein